MQVASIVMDVLTDIQILLGHKSVDTTTRYVYASDRYAEKTHRDFHPLNKPWLISKIDTGLTRKPVLNSVALKQPADSKLPVFLFYLTLIGLKITI